MNNSRMGRIISEIKEFGIFEVLFHIYSRFSNWGGWKYRLYMSRKYAAYTSEQIIDKVERDFERTVGYPLDLDNPKDFDQKVSWLKLYNATPRISSLVDKYEVREYVVDKVGENYLVPLLGGWKDFDEIDFEMLPDCFVLKMNNNSGTNLIVKDKSSLDKKKARKLFKLWEDYNFAYSGKFEMQYRDIVPRIIAEQYIEQMDGNLYDYKIHCFNGKVKCIQVIGDRNYERHTAKQAFYDKNFMKMDMDTGDFPLYENELKRPKRLEEMVKVSETLSEGFPYVRVDLYDIEDKVYFGELTFTPQNGTHPGWRPKECLREWGDEIRLPEKYEVF